MSDRELPSPEFLRKLLRYDPETGKLFWLHRTLDQFATESAGRVWNKKHAGTEAVASMGNHGYKRGMIAGRFYLAHRVVLAICTGEWPGDQVDHINGDKCDNRLANLRPATHTENKQNQKLPKNNTSGFLGVSWQGNKWRAEVHVNGEKVCLGRYVSFDEAVSARQAANIKYGFHENHGKR